MAESEKVETLEQLAALNAQLEAMAGTSEGANEILELLARALLPPEKRDLGHMTWAEEAQPVAPQGDDVERRMKAAEARFRTLVEQIPAVTFMAVLGEGQNEIYVSPHVEAMLGYSQDEWLKDPFLWYWRLHPDDRALWNAEFARGCYSGGPFRAECRFLARDGAIKWIHGEARIVRDERGRPMFLQGVAFDITESKRAQEILLKEAVRTARMEQELSIARRMQMSILPRNLAVEGLDIAASMEPATEVGGDYYDVRPFPGGAWIAIGDVAGHGLNAGLIMMMVQSGLAALVDANPSSAAPSELLCVLNDVLHDNVRRRIGNDEHVTMTLLRYTNDGTFVFAGAHEVMLVCRAATRKVEQITTPGTWIGGRRNIRSVTKDSTMKLEPNDLLVLYSDGLTEATNVSGEMYDIDRLEAAIESLQDRPVEEVRAGLMQRIHGWLHVQDDDMSLVVLRYKGA